MIKVSVLFLIDASIAHRFCGGQEVEILALGLRVDLVEVVLFELLFHYRLSKLHHVSLGNIDFLVDCTIRYSLNEDVDGWERLVLVDGAVRLPDIRPGPKSFQILFLFPSLLIIGLLIR